MIKGYKIEYINLIKRVLRSNIVKILEFIIRQKYKISNKNEVNYKKEFKKILLIHTLGIGDLIMSMPFIYSLKNEYKNSEIDLLANCDLIDKSSQLSNIFVFTSKKVLVNFIKEKYGYYDLVIIMNRKIDQTLILELLNPKYKLGYLAGLGVISNFVLKQEGIKAKPGVDHYSNMSLKILDSLGINRIYKYLDLIYSKEIIDNVDNLISTIRIDSSKKNLLINPFFRRKTRSWKIDNFFELVNRISDKYNIFLTGSPRDVNGFKDKTGKIIPISLPLKSNMYFFSKYIDVMVTPDSGPMHMGYLAGIKKIITLWGPTNPDKILKLAETGKTSNLVDFSICKKGKCPYMPCYNYNYEPICGEPRCTLLISVADVMKKLEE